MFLDLYRENDLDWCMPTNASKNMEQSVQRTWNYLTTMKSKELHQIYIHFDSILNEEKLQSKSHKEFNQLSVLFFCLISRMFSVVNSSCEEIAVHLKLFLPSCNTFSKTMKK